MLVMGSAIRMSKETCHIEVALPIIHKRSPRMDCHLLIEFGTGGIGRREHLAWYVDRSAADVRKGFDGRS